MGKNRKEHGKIREINEKRENNQRIKYRKKQKETNKNFEKIKGKIDKKINEGNKKIKRNFFFQNSKEREKNYLKKNQWRKIKGNVTKK